MTKLVSNGYSRLPPGDETGVALPISVRLGGNEKAQVVLRHVLVFSTGLSFELVCAVRALDHEIDLLGGEPSIALSREADGTPRPLRTHVGGPGELMFIGGGGGGAMATARFWLSPAPKLATLPLVVSWSAVGLDVTQEVSLADLGRAAEASLSTSLRWQ